MSAVKPVPDGMHTVTPHLVCKNAVAAIEFYKKAFGATEEFRLPTQDGRLMHACVKIGDSKVFLVDEFPEFGPCGTGTGGSKVTIHLQVPDCDATYANAVAAGATSTMPLSDCFWGDRYGQIVDPFGHTWSIATSKKVVSPAEMKAAMDAMMQNPPA